MTFPKLLAFISLVLFGIIGIASLFKDNNDPSIAIAAKPGSALEIELDEVALDGNIRIIAPSDAMNQSKQPSKKERLRPVENLTENLRGNIRDASNFAAPSSDATLPDADRISELFNRTDPRLPIVETITYKSRVAWQKGRPAWLSDYASHYSTSRHFIARSLNGSRDYFKQDVAEGDRFNVLRQGIDIEFYLLIDTSRCKMWFYYVDLNANERVLLKTYTVGLGRFDSSKPSGMLTPLGKYSLGSKIAIYKPKSMGIYEGNRTEMIRVFGSRWLPFDKEIGLCTAQASGFGIHGVPWNPGPQGELVEDYASLGKYESDGCIRLSTEDIEELFAIIITRPTTVELVRDFSEANSR